MNETEHAAGAQTEPQETNLNAPSARLSAAPAPGREETNTPDRDTLRTDPVQDQADYEGLQLPEDLTLPGGALEELKDLARELGLSCGQVQKLLDFETRYARSGAQNGAEENGRLWNAGPGKPRPYTARAVRRKSPSPSARPRPSAARN